MGSMISGKEYELLKHVGEYIVLVFLIFTPLLLMYRKRFYLKGIKYYPLLFSLIELPIIISCIYLICSGTVLHVTDYQQKDALNPYIYPSLSCLLSVMGFFLFAIIMLYLRPRLKSYLLMMGIPLACYLVYFARDQYDKISHVTNGELVSPYTAAVNPSLMVPEVWVVVSKLLFLLVPLVAPFLLVRSLRQEYLFLFWLCISSAIVSFFLTDPIHVYQGYIISVAFLVMLGLVIYYAPISRRNLRDIFGISRFSKNQKRTSLLVLLLLFGVNTCFVWYLGIHHHYAMNPGLEIKSWRYPAELDLVDLLGKDYGRSYTISEFEKELSENVHEIQWCSGSCSLGMLYLKQGFSDVEHDLIKHKDQLDHYQEMVQNADYFLDWYAWDLSMLRVREMSRLIVFRARCSLFRGDLDSFCQDIDGLYQFSVISKNCELVPVMIGYSVQGLANGLVEEYLNKNRNNPQNLLRIKELLDKRSEGCSQLGPFDYSVYAYQKYQDYYIVGVDDPNTYDRAFAIQQRNVAEYDHLRLLTALYLYYHDYAEWPDELSQLVPVYIDEIPSNPHTGKPYLYSFSDEGVSLETKVTKYPDSFYIYYDYPIGGDIIPANVPNDGFEEDEKDQKDLND